MVLRIMYSYSLLSVEDLECWSALVEDSWSLWLTVQVSLVSAWHALFDFVLWRLWSLVCCLHFSFRDYLIFIFACLDSFVNSQLCFESGMEPDSVFFNVFVFNILVIVTCYWLCTFYNFLFFATLNHKIRLHITNGQISSHFWIFFYEFPVL